MASVPRYIVDLDAPADSRWNDVIRDFKEHVGEVNNFVEKTIKDNDSFMVKLMASIVETTMSVANQTKFVFYHKELKAIATASGIPLGRVVMMQLVYEACAMCTSVAVPAHTALSQGGRNCQHQQVGTMAHIRTMDWEMDFLRKLTLEVEFHKGGRPVHTATTWAGYVGVLTGLAHRPSMTDNFSVSVNFRSKGSGNMWTNLKQAITRGWPIGFLVRESMESAASYDQAVSWLRNSELIAPCYFTVTSARPFTACLITRERTKEERFVSVAFPATSVADGVDVAPLQQQKISKSAKVVDKENEGAPLPTSLSAPFVVQANIDHWSSESNEDIMNSIERRGYIQEALGGKISEGAVMDDAFLWKLMSRRVVCNSITIYGTLMYPSTGVLETRTPVAGKGFDVSGGGAVLSRE